MATSKNGPKTLIIILVLLVAAAAGYGYFNQSGEMRNAENEQSGTQVELQKLPKDHPVYTAREGEIVTGKAEAPVTVIEYASLSCPHCAHFQENVYPGIKKNFLDTGKAKFVFRHFPLNEPAMNAAQLIECVGGEQRKIMVNALFASQKDWAFDKDFKDKIKNYAALNGMDTAGFTSCMADKSIEQRILGIRTEAAKVLGIEHTPTLIIQGELYKGELSAEAVSEALSKYVAQAPAPKAAAEEKAKAPEPAQAKTSAETKAKP